MKERWIGSGAAVGIAGLMAVVCGCSPTARRDETVAAPLNLSDAQVAEGQRVFMAHCYQCHVGGEAGLGPGLNDKPLPEWAIKYQVRHGLGAMPAFSAAQIPDDQLEPLVRYMKAVRALRRELTRQ